MLWWWILTQPGDPGDLPGDTKARVTIAGHHHTQVSQLKTDLISLLNLRLQVWQLHVKKASLQIAWILQTQSIHSFHILKITHLCKLFLRYKSTTMSRPLVYENHPGKIYVNNDYEKYECEHLLCPCLPQISMKQRPEQPLLSRAHHPSVLAKSECGAYC